MKTVNIQNQIPSFKTEDQEREFWSKEDSTKYLDWSKAKKVRFENLKPTTKTISLRLPASLLEKIKVEAHKKDIPYQSYMKMILSQQVSE